MSWENYDDALEQIRSVGILVDSLEIGTHRPVREKVEGDREKRGWYWLTETPLTRPDGQAGQYIVGSYGVWRGNDNGAIKIALPSKNRPQISEEERKAIAARHRENAKRTQAIRDAEADRAAQEAARVWRKYLPSGESDYLKRKGVGAHGMRFSPSGNGTVAVPMCDTAGRVWGLQIIRGKDRAKKLEKDNFPKGLAKQGHFHALGAITPGGIVLLAEGYATAATLFESTMLPVVVAFDAGNLRPVAEVLHKTYPGVRILICADDDYLTDGNPGVKAAQAAALAVSGAVCIPQFPTDRAGKKLTDFNDLQHDPAGGQHLVRAQVEEAIRAAGWKSTQLQAPARPTTQGSGERPNAVSLMPPDDAVERFVPLDDGTGKYLFDFWTKKIVQKDQMLALLPAGIRWDDIKRHPAWVARGAYYLDQVGFDPAGEDHNCLLNTWAGWPTKPAAGSCEIQLDILRYLCSGEADTGSAVYDWIIKWLAYPIQNPGAKMQSAIVVHGPQGTGKSRFFESYMRIFGEYGILLNQGAIEDKFNADWVSRKLFVLADEIVARQEMYHIKNQLKGFITGDWVRVNPKNLVAYKERNHMNMVFLSNEKQPVILENDDRRHCVIWTPPVKDEKYYLGLSQEINNGGTAALHQYLLQVDLTGFHPWTKPPRTKAKDDLIRLSQESPDVFIEEWISGDAELPFCPCKSSDLYQAYLRWCRQRGEFKPRNDRAFAASIDKRRGWHRAIRDVYTNTHYTGGTQRTRIVIPSDTDFSSAAKNGWSQDLRYQDTKTPAQWFTDGVFTFKNAIDDGKTGESA